MTKPKHPDPALPLRSQPRRRPRSPANAAPRLRFSIPAAALPLAAAGCGVFLTGPSDGVEEIARLPRALSAAEAEIIGANNRFAFDLLAQANRPGDNLFLSPLSVSMALGMALNGAAGETWNQMRAVLGFGRLAEEEINASQESLLELLVGLDPAVETMIGNSVWTRRGFPVHSAFLDAARETFDAEAAELDFASPSASERINDWVRAATDGRIDDIVPAVIPDSVVMYLINAIYFRGSWTFRFDPSDTRNEPFHLDNGGSRNVPLMSADMRIGYQESGRFQAVDVPYGGRAFSMTVLLPQPGISVDSLAASLDAEDWEIIADGFHDTDLQLFLPRFRMTRERTLNSDLAALGMVDAFDQRADFTRLSPVDGLILSEVRQKSWVEVNEEGTEAAAATAVTMGPTSGPVVVRADKPFLFFIRERLSGAILFAGKLASPSGG